MNENKRIVWLIVAVILIITIPLVLKSFNKNDKDIGEQESELYVEQIWFKNIEMLNNIPIDQSLLIQDEITYYFQNEKKHVEEVELVEGSLKELGDYKLEFKAKYNKGTISVVVDKDKVIIKE